MGQDGDLGIPEIDDSGMSKNYALVAENQLEKSDPPQTALQAIEWGFEPCPTQVWEGDAPNSAGEKRSSAPPFEEFPRGGLGCSGEALRSESK